MSLKHSYSVFEPVNPVLRHVETHIDVVFDDVLSHSSHLHVVGDKPALAGGGFRLTEIVKSC